jgi:periplasmic divalent cation tolerance protein
MSDFLQVSCTTSSRDEAARLAVALVERRLAGCVQIVGPVRSVYRWQEAVEQADEWLCLIKTTRAAYDCVEATIRDLHTYECPEIVATPLAEASAAYRQWLENQVD